MNRLPPPLFGLALFAALLAAPLFAASAPVAKDKGLEILITADAIPSPEGFRPKPDRPIYYLLFHDRQTIGDIVAGVKLPSPEVVEKALVPELEKQGFVRARDGGPLPDIALFAVVGDSNFKDEIPRDPYEDPAFRPYMDAVNVRQELSNAGLTGLYYAEFEGPMVKDPIPTLADLFMGVPYPSFKQLTAQAQEVIVAAARRRRNAEPARQRNAIKALVGATKVDRALANRSLSSSEAEKIAWAAFDNQYYLSLSAVEARKLPDGDRRFLWRTTMLIDWRVDFSVALPTMIAQAGPMFGTDVAVPGFVNTAQPRETKVEIGPARVVTEKDSPPGPKK